jgi:WD repeat and SOF domain-containing protein 1
LKEKYKLHPEIRKIERHRHVPRPVYAAQKERRAMLDSRRRKEGNRRAHSKPGTVPYVSDKVKKIVQEDE